jgi:uncharacterized membrane protein YgcG
VKRNGLVEREYNGQVSGELAVAISHGVEVPTLAWKQLHVGHCKLFLRLNSPGTVYPILNRREALYLIINKGAVWPLFCPLFRTNFLMVFFGIGPQNRGWGGGGDGGAGGAGGAGGMGGRGAEKQL